MSAIAPPGNFSLPIRIGTRTSQQEEKVPDISATNGTDHHGTPPKVVEIVVATEKKKNRTRAKAKKHALDSNTQDFSTLNPDPSGASCSRSTVEGVNNSVDHRISENGLDVVSEVGKKLSHKELHRVRLPNCHAMKNGVPWVDSGADGPSPAVVPGDEERDSGNKPLLTNDGGIVPEASGASGNSVDTAGAEAPMSRRHKKRLNKQKQLEEAGAKTGSPLLPLTTAAPPRKAPKASAQKPNHASPVLLSSYSLYQFHNSAPVVANPWTFSPAAMPVTPHNGSPRYAMPRLQRAPVPVARRFPVPSYGKGVNNQQWLDLQRQQSAQVYHNSSYYSPENQSYMQEQFGFQSSPEYTNGAQGGFQAGRDLQSVHSYPPTTQVTLPSRKPRPVKTLFHPYVSEAVKKVGLESGIYVKGTLVVSPKSPDQAYVRIPGQETGDVNICGQAKRNRAFCGDVVVVEILDRKQWKIRPECIGELQAALGIHELGDAVSKDDLVQLIESNLKIRTDSSSSPEPLEETLDELALDGAAPVITSNGNDVLDSSPSQNATAVNGESGLKRLRKAQNGRRTAKQGRMWMDLALENLGVENIPEKWLLKTGKVVFIESAKGSRLVVCRVREIDVHNTRRGNVKTYYVMEALDARTGSINVDERNFPPEHLVEYQKNSKILFMVEIARWDNHEQALAEGKIVRVVGESASVASHTASILAEHNVDESVFPEDQLQQFIATMPTSLTEEEMKFRQDFRENCVFTIDPPDAKDLDDAVSCQPLGNGLYRVAVHIADVAYMIPEGSPVDLFARQRATTVYLVNKVVHMLPPGLINAFCSLDPNEDRRTFSAVFVLTEDGEMMDYSISRGVIRSCAKLSYLQAQTVVDDPTGEWTGPAVVESSSVSVDKIKQTILDLVGITQAMRRKRFENGSLQIDQPEFRFQLDPEGFPAQMNLQEHWSSCQLIEELALLTNMTVAKIIFKSNPDLALLRRHLPPLDSPMKDMQKRCSLENYAMDIDSAKTIQRSLNQILSIRPDLAPVLSLMCAKPMKLADYICTGSDGNTWHYALGVEHYTHMTSPIRRYPDIVVHRLLASALSISPSPNLTPDQLHDIVINCNEKKLAARKCQEASWDLFMGLYVQKHGPLFEEGIVVAVYGPGLAVEVLVSRLGITKRLFVRQQPGMKSVKHRVEKEKPLLDVVWEAKGGDCRQTLGVWSPVRVKMFVEAKEENPRNLKIVLERPTEQVS